MSRNTHKYESMHEVIEPSVVQWMPKLRKGVTRCESVQSLWENNLKFFKSFSPDSKLDYKLRLILA